MENLNEYLLILLLVLSLMIGLAIALGRVIRVAFRRKDTEIEIKISGKDLS